MTYPSQASAKNFSVSLILILKKKVTTAECLVSVQVVSVHFRIKKF